MVLLIVTVTVIYIYLVSTNNSNNDGCDTFTLLPLQYNNFDSIYQT